MSWGLPFCLSACRVFSCPRIGLKTDVSAAMDWLLSRQDVIEAKLAARHLTGELNPAGAHFRVLTLHSAGHSTRYL